MEGFEHFLVGFAVEVNLVENDSDGYVVYLACHQNAVEERKLDFRKVYRRDDECTVEIGCYDM